MKGKKLKIALVCDWLVGVGGAERVLLALHQMYPNAPIYTSQYNKQGIKWFSKADIRTGWLQIFPLRFRRLLGPLRTFYFRHLDLSDYDIIISVTGAEAKGIKTKGKTHQAIHICYCHIPTQYYWGMYTEYMKNPGFGRLNPLARIVLKLLINPLRKLDYSAASRPDLFLAPSLYAKKQIKKYYKREAKVIPPPVDLKKFSTYFSTSKITKTGKSQAKISQKYDTTRTKNQVNEQKNSTINIRKNQIKQGYIVTSRQVTWKRIDLCIEACKKLNRPLLIIGSGPEHEYLSQLAANASFIKFLPEMSTVKLKKHLANSKAYLFPSLEPFGLAPVEALACGCPVIAFKKGGALDYVKPDENGIFFNAQSVNSLTRAIRKFERTTEKFSEDDVKNTAIPYDITVFKKRIRETVYEKTH